jgi:hypothetical protein
VKFRNVLLANRDVSVAQQQRRLVTVQRQVGGTYLEDSSFGPQLGYAQRRLGPPSHG